MMVVKRQDDARLPRTRIVLDRKEITARGISFFFGNEQISDLAHWRSHDDHRHRVLVFRGCCPSGRVMCDAGDICWVPAGSSNPAVGRGDVAQYCSIAVPRGVLDDAVLLPRTQYRDPLFHHLVEEVYSAAGRDDAAARLLIDSVAENILLLIQDRCVVIPSTPRQRRTFDAATHRMLVQYLNDSLHSDIRLDALAQLTGMSVQGFISAFRQSFQSTPYQYLLDRRVERAQTLLLTPSLSIAEIASAVGFRSPGYFATAFKRRVGVSPSAYRRGH